VEIGDLSGEGGAFAPQAEKIFAYVVDNQTYDEIRFDPDTNTYVASDSFDFVKEIDACTKILVHYNKILVYGNGSENIYASVVANPAYFTASGVLTLEDNFASPILNVTPYKDILLVFTDRSISGIVGAGDLVANEGSSFSPYILYSLETNVGILGPEAAIAIDNLCVLATSEAIYAVNQVNINERRIELKQIDKMIENTSTKGLTPLETEKVAMGY
jgi:hypothetical protein